MDLISNIIELFYISPYIYYSFIFITGLLVGSFLNVVIFRLPQMMEREWKEQCCELLNIEQENKETSSFNLILPGSHCPNCNQKIRAVENIPVISFLFLKGQCRHCKNKISLRYPIIELVSALAVLIVAIYFGVSLQAMFAFLLTWSLIALSMIDFDHQLLPDDITLPFLWLGVLLNYQFNVFTTLESSILGAIFGYMSLWTVYIAFKIITKKEGMGHGDFKLLAMLGAWLGWEFLPLIIIMSSFVGAVIGISMIIFSSHDKSIPIPFGPYLAIAGWITMIWGPYIMSVYLNTLI